MSISFLLSFKFVIWTVSRINNILALSHPEPWLIFFLLCTTRRGISCLSKSLLDSTWTSLNPPSHRPSLKGAHFPIPLETELMFPIPFGLFTMLRNGYVFFWSSSSCPSEGKYHTVLQGWQSIYRRTAHYAVSSPSISLPTSLDYHWRRTLFENRGPWGTPEYWKYWTLLRYWTMRYHPQGNYWCCLFLGGKCLLGLDRNQSIYRDRASRSSFLACETKKS